MGNGSGEGVKLGWDGGGVGGGVGERDEEDCSPISELTLADKRLDFGNF